MKISPVNFNPVNSIKLKNNFNQSRYSSSISNDTFVRSSNVNFEGKAPTTDYIQFKEELTQYVYNSDEVDFSEIEKMVQKICPEVTVCDMNNLPPSKVVSYGTAAYTDQQLAVYQDLFGRFRAKTLPQKMFLAKPKNNSQKEKIIFLDRTLHEFTHVLQESKSDDKFADIVNKRNITEAQFVRLQKSLKFANQLFTFVESEMHEKLATLLKNHKSLPSVVSNSFNYVDSFRRRYKIFPQTELRNNLDIIIQQIGGNVDKDLVFEIMNYKARAEKEAYSHALEFDKEALGLENKKTDFDVRLEMYDVLIDVTNK